MEKKQLVQIILQEFEKVEKKGKSRFRALTENNWKNVIALCQIFDHQWLKGRKLEDNYVYVRKSKWPNIQRDAKIRLNEKKRLSCIEKRVINFLGLGIKIKVEVADEE